MMIERITRRASDNEYLHRDFHGALSAGLDYLAARFGDQAVRDYLAGFARAFYAPLAESLRARGLAALRDHYRHLFEKEGGDAVFALSSDELRVEVRVNPAVTHMRRHGYTVSPLFHETVATVGRAICEGTPFDAELLAYDAESGRYTQRFFRRSP